MVNNGKHTGANLDVQNSALRIFVWIVVKKGCKRKKVEAHQKESEEKEVKHVIFTYFIKIVNLYNGVFYKNLLLIIFSFLQELQSVLLPIIVSFVLPIMMDFVSPRI